MSAVASNTLPEQQGLAARLAADSYADARVGVAAGGRGSQTSPWMITATGRAFALLDAAPRDVDPRDLAEQLSRINRFTGAPGVPYSVAQHCVGVANLVTPEAVPYALLHDAAEAYKGDETTPVQEAYDTLMFRLFGLERAFTRARVAFEDHLAQAIHARFALPWPPRPEIALEVKHADLVMLATEFRDLLPVPARGSPAVAPRHLPEPHVRRIKPWTWIRAADTYSTRLRQFGLV